MSPEDARAASAGEISVSSNMVASKSDGLPLRVRMDIEVTSAWLRVSQPEDGPYRQARSRVLSTRAGSVAARVVLRRRRAQRRRQPRGVVAASSAAERGRSMSAATAVKPRRERTRPGRGLGLRAFSPFTSSAKSAAGPRSRRAHVYAGTVPSFSPVASLQDLPVVGSTPEASTWDMKAKYPPSKEFEAAKDVAAFANHLGGTILVGAAEQDGTLVKYLPLNQSDADDVAAHFERSVAGRCRPPPLVETKRIPHEAGYVVAINVWPALAAPIGVRAVGDSRQGWGGDAWVFPLRVATQTTFLLPEVLPMYMSAKDRRTVLLLAKIPTGDKVRVHYQGPHGAKTFLWFFLGYDEERNEISFKRVEDGASQGYPIDRVASIFFHEREWMMLFDELPIT
ncbi:MAG: ATP-binding protein [Kofleriaceae bacterium]|nr:MAG: ATP-binding protein [Kofleriaceae bacterium]